MKRPDLLLIGIVAVVALAGIFGPTGAKVLVIQGSTSPTYPQNERYVDSYQCYQNADGETVCCYLEAGEEVCTTGDGKLFGPSREFVEGGQKTYRVSPTKGVLLG